MMGTVEEAVDAAAAFIGPFVEKNPNRAAISELSPNDILGQAVQHLKAINTADLASNPNDPYDASLAGIVYGLLDIISLLGILPNLSSGVGFGQRPRSVLTSPLTLPSERSCTSLTRVVQELIPILKQPNGSGVQPLLSQRVLPDIYAALAELSFAPDVDTATRSDFSAIFQDIMKDTPTARLISILTTFRQQPLPTWLKPVLSHELAVVPLRPQGVRHMIEFLSLAYLAKTSGLPQASSKSQAQVLMPLEAIAQVSQLLSLPPEGMTQDVWLRQLAPQLLGLLNGNEGQDLSRAAGEIIAGLLSKRSSGAPGTAGWKLFALPILRALHPKEVSGVKKESGAGRHVVVEEVMLLSALRQLSAITSSRSHPGLLKRLVGPVVFSLWAIISHCKSRPSVDPEWSTLAHGTFCRYIEVTQDEKRIDALSQNLFWDGEDCWTLMPGSQGGIEIRRRESTASSSNEVNNLLARVGALDSTVKRFISLLAEASSQSGFVGSLFLQVTKRWLQLEKPSKMSRLDDTDDDPLVALTDAMLSKALASCFKDQIAQHPHHIVQLMTQLILKFTEEHKGKVSNVSGRPKVSRKALGQIVNTGSKLGETGGQTENIDDDIVSFALSILLTLIPSAEFKRTSETDATLQSLIPALEYLVQPNSPVPVSSLITNSVYNLLHLLGASQLSASLPNRIAENDPLSDYRSKLAFIKSELTSPDPPDRTRALHNLHRFTRDPAALPTIDATSMTHMLLAASLADPDSYVHTAAFPVLLDMALYAPKLSIQIIVDAFIDVEEQSLKLSKGAATEERVLELKNALDYRLRTGELLNKICLEEQIWRKLYLNNTIAQYQCLKVIFEACLSVASRRGQRSKTQSTRTQLLNAERIVKEEGEAAWGGPIPNLLEPEDENPNDQAERDQLLKITEGWEDTGVEEDVRIRASALSIISTIVESRAALLSQAMVDSVLQVSLLTLTIETSEPKALLRRAAVLAIMALLRSLDADLEDGKQYSFHLSMKQKEEVERIITWIKDEDGDALTKDHAANVVEGLEALRMKELYILRGGSSAFEPRFTLGDRMEGLEVQPSVKQETPIKRLVEELE